MLGRSAGAILRLRWVILPVVLGLVIVAALAVRELSAPLSVSASVAAGDRAVVRSSTIVLTFNQDMDASSVKAGLRIAPAVPYQLRVPNPRTFEVEPQMQPDTSYAIQVVDARKALGFGTKNWAMSFRTEPAPQVTAASFNDAPLTDGQQNLPLRGTVKLVFSQPMDANLTPVYLDGADVHPGSITWDAGGTTATLAISLSDARVHSVFVPRSATNRRHDLGINDWMLSFTTMVQVPSAGSAARIGTSDAPIIIQIENSDQPTVRPQTGMQQADVIYEYISEFGIPRLTAIYWHPPTSLIGPVRSCRLITVQLEQMYRGVIYCSGANDYVLGQVWKWPNAVYDYTYMYPFMYRASDRYAPHNVIARPDQVTIHNASLNLPGLNYDIAPAHPDVPLPGATPATTITIPQHNVVWRYDPNSREYFKWQDGTPFTNVGTGQVHAKNVIVEHVVSYLDVNPGNTGVHHTYHTEYYELAGQGTADVYSDGGVIHVTWRHPNRDLPVVYYDANGSPVDLNTGLTWIHVIGSDQ